MLQPCLHCTYFALCSHLTSCRDGSSLLGKLDHVQTEPDLLVTCSSDKSKAGLPVCGAQLWSPSVAMSDWILHVKQGCWLACTPSYSVSAQDAALGSKTELTAARYQHKHLGSWCLRGQVGGYSVSWTLAGMVLLGGSLLVSAWSHESAGWYNFCHTVT